MYEGCRREVRGKEGTEGGWPSRPTSSLSPPARDDLLFQPRERRLGHQVYDRLEERASLDVRIRTDRIRERTRSTKQRVPSLDLSSLRSSFTSPSLRPTSHSVRLGRDPGKEEEDSYLPDWKLLG